MFMRFFTELREAKVPVTLKEYLMLMEALDKVVIERTVDEFYYLSRSALVKDEKNLDRFDQVFSHVFKGLEKVDGIGVSDIPAEWLKKLSDQFLTDEEKAQIEAMGGFEALMEELAKRMKDAKEGKGEGDEGKGGMGPKGDSPFGANGYHPEGVRVGQDKGRHGKAIKVWDKREYKNLDDSVELGTRNIKVALRRLRRWVREGAPEELDMNATIRGTAEKGYLDINLRAERRNKISVLIFFDIGGSMDSHIKVCEELFSAARSEFKNMEFYYFHNCLYESVWKDNRRRHAEKLNTWDILHKYSHDYKVIFVGDATMSPYEITYPGGSVEHWNEEAGAVWIDRVAGIYENMVWLNPTAERHWDYTPSIELMKQLVGDRMYPLTIEGLDKAMRELSR
ncbi:MAG: VWA domain-containing protein [Phenylobacterium sp.]|uniref:VWA domain-containing protein n=1 Tax=Phenylobacterium ferrooxidans TaxID=2982689 RepID=A0ABW6CJ52_9CAUL|nr:VWA domain-containing protein [Phenylobacterium sp.]MDO8913785.1 VWA domain-containing protein [Phenylobacterium sp.]MDP2008875.1 VWA domain-containing protein [Phenylobacterium sp.]MDP3635677.1 VWA domain-containing protein [Phenylobacterium sp.]MDP3869855.1 VWA domain-containing protein [Phenylobacterium sp.]HQT54290.1 VWA domain-containing protein [Phenylobacterium sp.]